MKIFFAAAIGAGIFLVGCQGRTDLGDCVGIGAKQNPQFEYRASTRNVVLGIVFVETIVVPIVIAADEFYCPVEIADGMRVR